MMNLNSNDFNGIPMNVGYTPPNHGLWHLAATGVVDNMKEFRSEAWEAAQKSDPVRIALLDTPVAANHPNLVGAIDLGLMRDFSVRETGAFPYHEQNDEKQFLSCEDKKSREKILEIADEYKGKDHNNLLMKAISDERENAYPTVTYDAFNAHGTGMSGLIGGRPSTCEIIAPVIVGQEEYKSDYINKIETELPYCGVNPFSTIIPISLPTAPTVATVLNALRYAQYVKAEIIVIVSSWQSQHQDEDWNEVEEVLKEISEDGIIILCAAGNEGDISDVYPSKLSNKEGLKNLYTVTACDEKGKVLSYAPKFEADNAKALKSLSAESSRYDRDEVVLSPWEYTNPIFQVPSTDAEHFHYKHIISVDVPGRYGYSPSGFHYDPIKKGVHLETNSLYCSFSGTSAATAIAAGLVSLAIKMKKRDSGNENSQFFDLKKAIALFGDL